MKPVFSEPMLANMSLEEKANYGLVDPEVVVELDDIDGARHESWGEGFAAALHDVFNYLDGLEAKKMLPADIAKLIKENV